MESTILEKAGIITTAVPCTKRDFQEKVAGDKICVIENGYDQDDFLAIIS